MPNPNEAMHHRSEQVAARAETRWAIFVIGIIALLLGMIAYTSLHFVMMPTKNVETINPSTLHLAGEFTEDNLGSAVEPDGSVTVRIVGQQYSFTPQCILVPDQTPVKFRVTSADVIHGFIIAETNVNVMLEPGYISTFDTRFRKPGMHVMPCHEFCGVGHAGMWARVKVIDKETFFKQAANERRQNCVQ
ncbi:cytochrome C oxidase subunit II [Noviherbaspirillum malthae]|uniref:cytochrome C oxidase subunit II n=1 Tax=Noviherbaspirillum malthae TaxID=1260987 RepID=UPI003F6A2B0F